MLFGLFFFSFVEQPLRKRRSQTTPPAEKMTLKQQDNVFINPLSVTDTLNINEIQSNKVNFY